VASLRTITFGFVDCRWSFLFGFSFLPSSVFIGSCGGRDRFSSGFRRFAGRHHEQCLGGELVCKLIVSSTLQDDGRRVGNMSGVRGDPGIP
jgi:hypothetical protein